VRSIDESRDFIDTRYRPSYREHGYGLYAVDLRADNTPIGICGFLRRDTLPGPDIGFAFLPEYERQGYGFESASAMMRHGREVLEFSDVLAITSLDNDVSGHLLKKLGFEFARVIDSGGEKLKLFASQK
jgi:RimJ/RimL family protein N-acetyltransferase